MCKTKTGFFSCKTEARRSDLEPYGPGIVVFFQFIKYLLLMYCVMTVLAIPIMIVYYSRDTEGLSYNFKSMITLISVGNSGESDISCGIGSQAAV